MRLALPRKVARTSSQQNLRRLQDFARAAGPQIRIALHLFAERRIALVILQLRFKLGDIFNFEFQDDAVEFSCEVRQYAIFGCRRERSYGCCCFQLGSQFAGVPGFGDSIIL